MGVSKNNGTPKSSIWIGFSIINHPFWGFFPYFWKHPYLNKVTFEQKKPPLAVENIPQKLSHKVHWAGNSLPFFLHQEMVKKAGLYWIFSFKLCTLRTILWICPPHLRMKSKKSSYWSLLKNELMIFSHCWWAGVNLKSSNFRNWFISGKLGSRFLPYLIKVLNLLDQGS